MFCRFNGMLVDTLENILAELSMRYKEEKENNRKFGEKLTKEISQLKKDVKIEKRRVSYYQYKHLKAKKALINRFDSEDETATKETFDLPDLD